MSDTQPPKGSWLPAWGPLISYLLYSRCSKVTWNEWISLMSQPVSDVNSWQNKKTSSLPTSPCVCDARCLSFSLPVFEIGFLPESGAHWFGWLAGHWAPGSSKSVSVSLPPRTGVADIRPQFTDARDLVSGPHACMSNILLPYPFPQLLSSFWFIFALSSKIKFRTNRNSLL